MRFDDISEQNDAIIVKDRDKRSLIESKWNDLKNKVYQVKLQGVHIASKANTGKDIASRGSQRRFEAPKDFDVESVAISSNHIG